MVAHDIAKDVTSEVEQLPECIRPSLLAVGAALFDRWPAARRLLRYSCVSVISTSISLSVLVCLIVSGALSPGWANVVATLVGIGPSFELNRRWVWSKRGRRSLTAEVLPFAALSFGALALSTLAVSVAVGWAAQVGLSRSARACVAVCANLASFGTMWIVQYVMLDRLLFRQRPRRGRAQVAMCASPAVDLHSQNAADPKQGSSRAMGQLVAEQQ